MASESFQTDASSLPCAHGELRAVFARRPRVDVTVDKVSTRHNNGKRHFCLLASSLPFEQGGWVIARRGEVKGMGSEQLVLTDSLVTIVGVVRAEPDGDRVGE